VTWIELKSSNATPLVMLAAALAPSVGDSDCGD
jgi:hypothetical protein